MSKEWILNSVTNRFQLNFKRNVGPVSELIRKCAPKDIKTWESFYYSNAYPKEHLKDLGQKLYVKITEVIQAEISEITEQDCIDYIVNPVINRTYDGYITEIQTIYGQLEGILKQKIIPAPDEWDRLYNVDFYINLPKGKIGLQIKPITFRNAPDKPKWEMVHAETHQKFEKAMGGKVFTVYSIKEGQIKIIKNPEIITEIQKEVERLS